MKKSFIFFILSLLVAVCLNFIVGPLLASYILNESAGEEIAVGGLTLSFEQIRVGRIVSPQISVQNLALVDPFGYLRVEIPSIVLNSYWAWESSKPNLKFDIKVVGLYVAVVQPSSDSQKPTVANELGKRNSDGAWLNELSRRFFNVSIRLALHGAGFRLSNHEGQEVMALDPFELNLDIGELMSAEKWFELLLQGSLTAKTVGGVELGIPVELRTGKVVMSGQQLSASSASLTLSGLSTVIKGTSNLHLGSHDWDLKLEIPSLLDLPIPKHLFPYGRLFGGLKGTAKVQKVSGKDLKLVSSFSTHNFGGDLHFENESTLVKGRFRSDLSWDVQYLNGQLQARNGLLNLQADDLEIKSGSYFHKSKHDKLHLKLKAYVAKNTLVIRTERIRLNQLGVDLSGSFGLENDQLGSLRFRVKPTKLEGLEKLFPVLARQPMQGVLQIGAHAHGRFGKGLEGLDISVESIRLENFKTSFNYRDDQSRNYVIGSVSGEIIGGLQTKGKEIKSMRLESDLNLSQLEMDYRGQLQKKMGEKFRFLTNLKGRGNSVFVKTAKLELGDGSIELSGSAGDLDFPKIDMRLKISQLQAQRFRGLEAWPSTLTAKGLLSADVSLRGQYDRFRGIKHSDLLLEGSVGAILDLFDYRSEKEPVQTTGEIPSPQVAPLKTVPSFLPAWPLFQGAKLALKGTVRDFRFQEIKASQLGFKALVSKGGISISSQVRQIFGGKLKVKKLLVPLIWENPFIRSGISFKNIQIAKVLNELRLDSLPRMKGVVSGAVNLNTEIPQSQRFLDRFESKGALDLTEFELTQIKLMESLLKPLSSIPGLKITQNQRIKGFEGAGSFVYSLKRRKMHVGRLNLRTQRGDALDLEGDIDLEGSIDMTGSMSLVDPLVKGDFYTCNQDSQGRMTFPIVVKSNYKSPDFQIPKSSIKALLEKTLSCQKKKLQVKAKTEAKNKLKELESNLESETKDQLKDLFN